MSVLNRELAEAMGWKPCGFPTTFAWTDPSCEHGPILVDDGLFAESISLCFEVVVPFMRGNGWNFALEAADHLGANWRAVFYKRGKMVSFAEESESPAEAIVKAAEAIVKAALKALRGRE